MPEALESAARTLLLLEEFDRDTAVLLGPNTVVTHRPSEI